MAGVRLLRSAIERAVHAIARASLFTGAIARIKSGLTLEDAQRRIDALVRVAAPRSFRRTIRRESDWRVRLVPLKDNVVGDVRQPLLLLFVRRRPACCSSPARTSPISFSRARARADARWRCVKRSAARHRGSCANCSRKAWYSPRSAESSGVVMVARDARISSCDWCRSVSRCSTTSRSTGGAGSSHSASRFVAGAVFGLAPALQIRRLDVTRVLKLEGRGSTGSGEQQRTRRLLVIGEFALSLVLDERRPVSSSAASGSA